jgi:Tfp pilus assembly protein PilF
MKKVLLLTLLFSIGTTFFAQNKKMMPVTTESKNGLTVYKQAMQYFDDVNLKVAVGTFKKALKEDPDFFMANYQLAFFYLMNRDGESFKHYAEAAINCNAKLSDAEEILREVLVNLKQGQINLSDLGKKLVALYPGDPNSYNNLVYFQTLAGDSTGVIETLNQAIKIAPNPASFYNQLGYAYITLNQNDKAEQAFDKYIELEPKNPNAYDSKGDYYMYIKDYYKAYQSYMNAHSIDPSYSADKAEIAKRLYEATEGKKLEIITI